jgi:hypothetical protein
MRATDHVTTAQRRERTAEASRANNTRLCDDAAAVSTEWAKGGVLGVPRWARGVQDRAVERRPKREPRLGWARRVSALLLAASQLHACTRACSEATRKGSQGGVSARVSCCSGVLCANVSWQKERGAGQLARDQRGGG